MNVIQIMGWKIGIGIGRFLEIHGIPWQQWYRD